MMMIHDDDVYMSDGDLDHCLLMMYTYISCIMIHDLHTDDDDVLFTLVKDGAYR